MKNGLFLTMLSGKVLRKNGMNHLYPPKIWSSSEENHALVELERDPVLWAFTKKPNDKFGKVLLTIKRIKDCNWTKTSKISESEERCISLEQCAG